ISGMFQSISATSNAWSASPILSSASRPWTAVVAVKPRLVTIFLRIIRIADESSMIIACTLSSLSAELERCGRSGPIGRQRPHSHQFEFVVDAAGGLRGTEDQPAARRHDLPDTPQDRSFGCRIEI